MKHLKAVSLKPMRATCADCIKRKTEAGTSYDLARLKCKTIGECDLFR